MAARQTRRQLQFSGFEMGLIATSFVVTVTSVFFLGLFVGRKNASHHAPAEDRVARIPVDDFTRYKRPAPIEKPKKEPASADTAVAAARPAAAPAGGVPGAKAPAATELAKVAPADPSAPGSPFTPPAGAEPAAKGADPNAKPDAASTDAAAKDAAAKEAAAKAAAAKAEKEKKDALARAEKEKKEKEKAEDEPTGRGYTVQILATRKQADADALLQKLKSRGYAAYIKKVADGGGAWYRVRVGSYGAFGEARAMADRCRHDLGLGQAFVSTE